MTPTILVVEDEPAIQELVAVNLRHAGFLVARASSAEEADSVIRAALPDLVLLDWMLPGQSGVALAKKLRSDERTRELPLIMLTARVHEEDKVQGLEAGADDYVTKPFSPRELMARLRRNLRKGKLTQTQMGHLRVDWQRADVFRDEARILLTAREFEVLRVLYENRERVLERDSLLEKVWGYDFEGDARVVDTTIKRLRSKVGQHLIETVRGLGYRLAL